MIATHTGVSLAAVLFGLAAGLAVLAFARHGPAQSGPTPQFARIRGASAAFWRLSQRLSGDRLRLRLMLAGYFSPWAAAAYRILQAGAALCGAVGGLLSAQDGHALTALACAISFGLAGAALPGFWIDMERKRRNARLSGALPYGIELLCVALSAGSTVEESLRRAAFGLRPFAPDLAGEFARLSFALGTGPGIGLGMGPGMRPAAWHSPSPALHDVARLLRQGALHGLRLIPSLRNLAQQLRTEQAIRREEAALRLGAKLTIPLILFFLPPIFLLILTPGLSALLKP
jgi:tight adherence protein C